MFIHGYFGFPYYYPYGYYPYYYPYPYATLTPIPMPSLRSMPNRNRITGTTARFASLLSVCHKLPGRVAESGSHSPAAGKE